MGFPYQCPHLFAGIFSITHILIASQMMPANGCELSGAEILLQ
jgi:hypothetical protein